MGIKSTSRITRYDACDQIEKQLSRLGDWRSFMASMSNQQLGELLEKLKDAADEIDGGINFDSFEVTND